MTKNPRKILVTGGAGYVGSVLIPILLKNGYLVSVFDKFYFGTQSLKAVKDNIEIIRGDIRDVKPEIFDGVTCVIHLAGLSNDPTSNFNPSANSEINTFASIRLAKLAKRKGVQRFIFASSCSIYDRGVNNKIEFSTELTPVYPRAHYSKSKREAELGLLDIATDNFCVTVLRKGTIHGVSPRMRFDLVLNTMIKNAFADNKLKVFSRGIQWRPIIDVNDVAMAYLKSVSTSSRLINGEIINIVGENLQIKELAKKIQEYFKEHLKKDLEIAYEQDEKLDRSYKVSGKKAIKVLSFSPQVSVEKSISSIVRKISKGMFRDFDNPKYYNIRWMEPLFIKEGI